MNDQSIFYEMGEKLTSENEQITALKIELGGAFALLDAVKEGVLFQGRAYCPWCEGWASEGWPEDGARIIPHDADCPYFLFMQDMGRL